MGRKFMIITTERQRGVGVVGHHWRSWILQDVFRPGNIYSRTSDSGYLAFRANNAIFANSVSCLTSLKRLRICFKIAIGGSLSKDA